MKLYSTSEASDLAGVTFTRLNRWATTGTLVPTTPAQGSGRPAKYSLLDVLRARAIGFLVDSSGGTYCPRVGLAVIKEASADDLTNGLVFKEGRATTALDLQVNEVTEPTLAALSILSTR
jgi:hypothetical protein